MSGMDLPGSEPFAEQRVHLRRFSGCSVCWGHREPLGGGGDSAGSALPLLHLAPGCSCPPVPGTELSHDGFSLRESAAGAFLHPLARTAGGDTLPSALPGRSRVSPAAPASRGWGKRASGYSLSCWSTQFPREPHTELRVPRHKEPLGPRSPLCALGRSLCRVLLRCSR